MPRRRSANPLRATLLLLAFAGVAAACLAQFWHVGRARADSARHTIQPLSDTQKQQPDCSTACLPVLLQGDAEADKAKRGYVGLQACSRCHLSGTSGKLVLPGGGEIPLMQDQWVFYKEIAIWSQLDKHVQAYAVLLNDRSKAMGKALGVQEIHRDRRCLACHTGYPQDLMPADEHGLVDAALEKKLDINLGVSCEGCHGPAGNAVGNAMAKGAEGWFEPHVKAVVPPYDKTHPWRFMSPAKKRDQYGFYDVRSPASKTALCTSCHLGDAEQGRVLTHEMYAAGHPPLPGFEVETFSGQMPRHWADLASKAASVQDVFLKYTKDPRFASYKKDDMHRSRSLLAGALMVAAEYLRLTGQLASDELPADDRADSPGKRAWPELAVFDCYACHHDLKKPSWRQQRPPPGVKPGRPALQEWPFVLASIAIKNTGVADSEYQQRILAVREAVAAEPFGKQRQLASSALSASAWLRKQAQMLEKQPFNRQQAQTVLKDIAEAASADLHGYDAARQLLWAFRVVNCEVNGLPSSAGDAHKRLAYLEKLTSANELTIDRWIGADDCNWKSESAANNQKQINDLGRKLFLLNLREGRIVSTKVNVELGGQTTTQERQTVVIDLGKVLPLIAHYDPVQFQREFRALAKKLE